MEEEIALVAAASAIAIGAIVKVILETSLLTDDQKIGRLQARADWPARIS